MFYRYRRPFHSAVLFILFVYGLFSYLSWLRTDSQIQQEHVVAKFDASKKPLLVLSPGRYKVYYEYWKNGKYGTTPTVQLADASNVRLIAVQYTASWPIHQFGLFGRVRQEQGTFTISRPGSYCIATNGRSWRYTQDTVTITGPLAAQK